MKLTRRLAIAGTGAAFRLAALARRRLGVDRTVYVGQRVSEYHRYWEEGARRIGATFEQLREGVWEVSRNGVRTRIRNYITKLDPRPIRWKAGDKLHCYRLATECGLPVPPHVVLTLDTMDHGRGFLASHPGPFVVKPAYGSSSGLGVTTGVRTWGQFFRAAVRAARYHERFLLETMVPGESWRLLVLDDRAIHAVRRRGVRVLGDGLSTIEQLCRAPSGPAAADDWIVAWTLAGQGLSSTDVPPAGQEVLVRSLPAGERRTSELRTAYTESVTHLVGDDVARRCVAVTRRLGSQFAGIDLIANDLRRPLGETGGIFLEINTTPGIHHHYLGSEDHRDPVAAKVLTFLLEDPRANQQGSR